MSTEEGSEITYLYRYEPVLHAVGLVLHEYPIIKRAPCGVWLDTGWGMKKFVLSGARRRFAHETPTGALTAFIRRNARYIQILKEKLEGAEQYKEVALNLSSAGKQKT